MRIPDKLEEKKLIGEFMDCDIHITYRSITFTDYCIEGQWIAKIREQMHGKGFFGNKMMIDHFNPNTSWELLIQIVEKIESFGYVVEIWCNYCCVLDKDLSDGCTRERLFPSHASTKIEAVFKTIVQFIAWYNKKNK